MLFCVKKYIPEIVGVTLCLTLSTWYDMSDAVNSCWYKNLIRPSFYPPAWVFAPVWTALYIIMGVSLGKMWRLRHKDRLYLPLFCIQFIFNVFWAPTFFGYKKINLAAITTVLIWAILLTIIVRAKKNQDSLLVALFIPYILWITFASALTIALYILNS